MERLESNSVDLILTSPPYNMTSRKGGTSDKGRYDIYRDWMSETDYLLFTVNLFKRFDKILKKNKVVIYNFSYSIESPSLPYKLVNEIEKNTNFGLVDTIVWKKKSGLPFPANKQRLSRNWEFVFVFVRKEDFDTFDIYKGISSTSEKTGQVYYNVFYNYIEASNNDGKCPFNNATFSTDLVTQLLDLYATDGYVVYDPFMGSGTTAVACKMKGLPWIGSELSENQIKWANDRLEKVVVTKPENILFE